MLNNSRSWKIGLWTIVVCIQPALSAAQTNIVWQHYRPSLITTLQAKPGMMTQVVFGQNEHIASIQNGDLAAWMVRVDKSVPNMLFIKPTLVGSDTNMTVVTDKHSYYFHLLSGVSLSQVQPYAIRFDYQTPVMHKSMQAKPIHHHYSYSGDHSIKPTAVYDDGRFIYMRFKQQQPIPAVFAVLTPSGHESMVNVRYHHHWLIVEQLAPQLTLRLGRYQVGSLFNDEWIDQYE